MARYSGEWQPRNRPLSRREALRLFGGALVAGGTLAACGPDQRASSQQQVLVGTRDNPARQPIAEDNPPVESGLEPEGGPLRVYNWADYIWTRVLKDFEEEFGVEVELTTFYNMEEATRKLRTGKVEFDVFFPTAEVVAKFVAGGLLQPLNHDYLPNLENSVWPMLADPYYDQGSRYTVPYTVYQTGIGWRTDIVGEDIAGMDNPWDAFWNSEYRGKVGLYDDYREAIGVGMFKSGMTEAINSAGSKGLDAARKNLIQLPDKVGIRYTIDGAYAKLPEGIFGLHQAWSGDMVNAPAYMPEGGDPSVLRYTWPPKDGGGAGGYINNDCMAVLKGAQSPVLAHAFLNYMIGEKPALKNFSWTGYQPPLKAIKPERLVADGRVPENLAPAVVEPEDFDRGQVPLQLTPEEDARWQEVWSRVQEGG